MAPDACRKGPRKPSRIDAASVLERRVPLIPPRTLRMTGAGRATSEALSGEEALLAADDAVEGMNYASSRVEPSPSGLRVRTARGLVINAGFQIVFAALSLVQRFAVAAFLTVSQFGI